MPIATIPVGLKPIAEGYSIGDMGGVMRTEVAGGASRYALEYARGTHMYSVTIIANSAQLSAWDIFYHRIIKKGAYPFYMDLNSGSGVKPHVVNILPSSTNITHAGGDVMIISFSVEAENPVYEMTDADAIALVDFYNIYADGSESFLNRLYTFARYDLEIVP